MQGLEGLFAGGMPQLRKTGNRPGVDIGSEESDGGGCVGGGGGGGEGSTGSGGSVGRQGGLNVPQGLGELFAGGMPQLRKTGNRPSLDTGGSSGGAPKPPAPASASSSNSRASSGHVKKWPPVNTSRSYRSTTTSNGPVSNNVDGASMPMPPLPPGNSQWPNSQPSTRPLPLSQPEHQPPPLMSRQPPPPIKTSVPHPPPPQPSAVPPPPPTEWDVGVNKNVGGMRPQRGHPYPPPPPSRTSNGSSGCPPPLTLGVQRQAQSPLPSTGGHHASSTGGIQYDTGRLCTMSGARPKERQSGNTNSATLATLPMFCKFYNSRGGCKLGNGKCPKMHLCGPFLRGRCKFGNKCQQSHNVADRQPTMILLQLGFNVQRHPYEILKDVREQMSQGNNTERSRHKSGGKPFMDGRQPQPPMVSTPPTTDRGENGELNICMFFLRGKCFYGTNCRNYHAKSHYQWQMLGTDGKIWKNLKSNQNMETELNYSDPSKDECFLGEENRVLKIDFVNMKFFKEGSRPTQIRRLGTAYSVLTQWLWYWKDSAGKWMEYGESDSNVDFKASLTSKEIEEKYQQDPEQIVIFSTSGHKYQLDMAAMTQVNVTIGSERPVRRRPLFDKAEKDYKSQSSMKDILAKLNELNLKLESRTHQTSEKSLPPNWDFDHVSDNEYFHIVSITKSGNTLREYTKIEQLFQKTLPEKVIKSIKRIQNIDLWERYERRKIKMGKRLNPGDTLDERSLFHGTSRQFVEPICQQGFDWRFYGTSVGVLYGNGSYFARDAKYSSSYTSDSTMFMVRVLVGEYTEGSSGIRLPPPKDTAQPHGERFDSCVNDVTDPTIFVMFQDDQSYPEYLIEY